MIEGQREEGNRWKDGKRGDRKRRKEEKIK